MGYFKTSGFLNRNSQPARPGRIIQDQPVVGLDMLIVLCIVLWYWFDVISFGYIVRVCGRWAAHGTHWDMFWIYFHWCFTGVVYTSGFINGCELRVLPRQVLVPHWFLMSSGNYWGMDVWGLMIQVGPEGVRAINKNHWWQERSPVF